MNNNIIQKNIYQKKYSNVNLEKSVITHEMKIFIKWLSKHDTNNKNQKILDLGGGFGKLGLSLKKDPLTQKYKYTNFEMSKEAVKAGLSYGLDSINGEIPETGQLPFKKESFDIIHCSQVIEHLLNPDIIFKEANRILKPGGYLFISTPNIASWLGRLMIAFGWQGYGQEVSTEYPIAGKGPLGRLIHGDGGAGFHLRLFTMSGLKDLYNYHNFKITKKIGARNFSFSKIKNLKTFLNFGAYLLDLIFSLKNSLASNILCFGQKTNRNKNKK